MLLYSIFLLLLALPPLNSKAIFVKRPKDADFISFEQLQNQTCPSSIEIMNAETQPEILDMAFLREVCDNSDALLRLKLIGNFQEISEGLFEKLPKLENFQGNQMENLTQLSLKTSNLEHLDLSMNGLKNIDLDVMENLLVLNLSRNLLEVQNFYMTSKVQPLNLKLKIFDISYNKLTRIDFFLSFWNLRTLIVNDNIIDHIKGGSLQKYPNLVSLNLARNKLAKIESGVFIGLGQLVNLDLSFNNLNTMDVQTINALGALEELNLDGNNIKDFKIGELTHKLEVLKLSNSERDVDPNSLENKAEDPGQKLSNAEENTQ